VSQNPPKPFWFDRVRPLLGLLLFVFAFGYRLIGIGWGLPNDLHNQSYHPDEEVIWNFSRAVKPAEFKFTPGRYNYGTLYLTLLRVSSDVVSGYGGGIKPGDVKSYWQFIARCHMAGRLISAFAGALTALAAFLMMRRFTRVLGAFFGGMFVAVAPAFVVHSRFQTVDVLATCLLALSLYYSTLLIPDREGSVAPSGKWLKYAALAGLFAGLSAGTKYTGILAVLSLGVAIILSKREENGKGLIVGLLLAVIGFVVGTPGVLLDRENFTRDFVYEFLHTRTGHDLLFVGVGRGFAYHFVNLIEGISIGLLGMALVALVYAAVKKQSWLWVLLAFALPYYWLIGGAEVLFLRYTFPLYPMLAAAFGWWMGYAHERKGRNTVVVVLGIFAIGFALYWSQSFTTTMSGLDARDQTALLLREWSKTTPGAKVGLPTDPWYYTPPLIPDSAIMRGGTDVMAAASVVYPPQQVHEISNRYGGITPAEALLAREMELSNMPRVVQHLEPNIDARYDWDIRLITMDKPDYIVFSNFEMYDPWRLRNRENLPEDVQLKVDRFATFDALLHQTYTLQSVIGAPESDYSVAGRFTHDLAYVQPVIWIWKRRT